MRAGLGYVDVTITSGESLSSAGYIGHAMLVAIIMPSDWTDAGISFAAGCADADGSDPTYNKVMGTDGSELTMTADASEHLLVDKIAGMPYVKVRSGTADSGVNQEADRTIRLVFQQINLGRGA